VFVCGRQRQSTGFFAGSEHRPLLKKARVYDGLLPDDRLPVVQNEAKMRIPTALAREFIDILHLLLRLAPYVAASVLYRKFVLGIKMKLSGACILFGKIMASCGVFYMIISVVQLLVPKVRTTSGSLLEQPTVEEVDRWLSFTAVAFTELRRQAAHML
ncbi:unnamed protein product, partial [Symbiodinium sp. CCMP2456]